MRTILLIISLVGVTALPALPQNGVPADTLLREIETLYNSARYLDAELGARRLREEQGLSDSAKVQIDKWIAFCLIAQGKTVPARERFVTALTMDPSFELDPILTSPKILTVFNDAKGIFLSIKRSSPGGETPPANDRQTITYRTFLFPGWEQMYRGKTTRGILFFGAGAAALGAGVTFEFLRADAREKYLKAAASADIASKYDTYNTYRKAEFYSFIAFAAVYIASEIDILSDDDASPVAVGSQIDPRRGQLLTVSVEF